MTEQSIMFSGAGVRALLAGWKTQTRLLANKHRKARLHRIGDPDSMRLTPALWRETAIGDRFGLREPLGLDKVRQQLFYRADAAPVMALPPADQPIAKTPLSSLHMP